MTEEPTPAPAAAPILAPAEITRRLLMLVELQGALAAQGIHSVLARTHRLVLQYNYSGCEPSGPTDPELHIFIPGGLIDTVATADGSVYSLVGTERCSVSDPSAAVAVIAQPRHRPESMTS